MINYFLVSISEFIITVTPYSTAWSIDSNYGAQNIGRSSLCAMSLPDVSMHSGILC